jgi:hypothetical protein
MVVALQLPDGKIFCGTAEAAELYGCSETHIRYMVRTEQIRSCRPLGRKTFIYEVEEIKALAAEREASRKAGKLGGRRPGRQAS